MRAHVDVKVTLTGETLPTAGACVRQLACVRPTVHQQLPRRQERLPAYGAQEIFLASVHLHVSCDARFAETFPTDSTQMGGAFMQALMLLERIVTQEPLLALAADEDSSSLVDSLVLIIARLARESLLTLAAGVPEVVELHVSLELIWMFKNLPTLQTFGFFCSEVFVHRSCAQKPFVFPRGLFPSALFLVFYVVLLLLTFMLFFNIVFFFAFPLFLWAAVYVLLFSVKVFIFLLGLCAGFFHIQHFLNGSCCAVLTLDVLLDLPLYMVTEGTLRAAE